jgi:hypothetical protein
MAGRRLTPLNIASAGRQSSGLLEATKNQGAADWLGALMLHKFRSLEH